MNSISPEKKNPEKFNTQSGNKAFYANLGMNALGEEILDVKEYISLKVDKKLIVLPKSVKSLIFLNIPSYAAGTNPWGGTKTGWNPQSYQDGIIEVLGLKGAGHMGMLQAGFSKGIKIAQGSEIEIKVKSKNDQVYAQFDGEPMLMQNSDIKLSFHGQSNMLCCNKSKLKFAKNKNL